MRAAAPHVSSRALPAREDKSIQARVSDVAPHAALRCVGVACDESGKDLAVFGERRLGTAGLSACPEAVQAELVVDLVEQQLLQVFAAGALDGCEVEIVVPDPLMIGLAGRDVRLPAVFLEERTQVLDFACGHVFQS